MQNEDLAVNLAETHMSQKDQTINTLDAVGLSCIRNDQMLFEDLGFNISAGEVLQITGPNGCGKTTLLRILCGFLMPDEGDVSWNGNNIRLTRSEYVKDICYVGHNNGIKEELTPLENLIAAQALSDARRDMQPEQALNQMGLNDLDYQLVKKLSSGQRRRVALARLLITKACLWILDEPFTSLDDSGKEIVKNIIDTHNNDGGITIVVTHDPVMILKPNIKKIEL